MLEVGTTVGGKFRIEQILGQGGMGVVAVATHLQLDQRVALKVLLDQLSHDPATLERFLREAQASAKLKSDHVCKVFDVGQLETGAPYIVMELLDGEDLGKLVARGKLEPATAADYVLQACVAVAEAHLAGIVHRDLKPGNLFVTQRLDGEPLIKVLDFGIAKAHSALEVNLTTTAAIMGSPAYMSPEQLRSARDVDARTDIWALGVILFELVTGELPFSGTTIMELAMNVAMEPPARLPAELDPRLATVIARCLEKELDRRYPSIAALASDLAPIAGAAGVAAATTIARLSSSLARVSGPRSTPASLAGAPTALTVSPDARREPPPTRRGRVLIVAGAVALLAGAGAVGFMVMHPGTKPKPAVHRHVDAGGSANATHDALVAQLAIDAGLDAGAIDPALRADLEQEIKSHDWRAVLDFANLETKDPSLEPMFERARVEYGIQSKLAYDAAVKNGQCDRAHAIARDIANRHLDKTGFDGPCTAKPQTPVPPPAPVDDPAAGLRATAETDRLLRAKQYVDAMRVAAEVVKKVTHLSQWMYTLASCDAKDVAAARDHYARINLGQARKAVVKSACEANHIDVGP